MVCKGGMAVRGPCFIPTPQPPLPAFFFAPPVERPPPVDPTVKAAEEAAASKAAEEAAAKGVLQPNPACHAAAPAAEAWTLPPIVQVVKVDMAGSKFLYEVVPVV